MIQFYHGSTAAGSQVTNLEVPWPSTIQFEITNLIQVSLQPNSSEIASFF